MTDLDGAIFAIYAAWERGYLVTHPMCEASDRQRVVKSIRELRKHLQQAITDEARLQSARR